ncbi:MAG: hypothetical protein JF593_07520 [Novosphingobium sp.]|nr:hypothetical protein [Novosphingobium sp.]
MIDREAAAAAREQAKSNAGPLARKVFEYTEAIERAVPRAKDAGAGNDVWAEVEALIDIARFERVGNFKEVMTWPQYRAMLAQWGGTTEFWSNFRAITEAGNRVFLELEEHNTPKGGAESVVNSLSLYEFDGAGKLVHLDIYLQYLPPGMDAAWGEVDFAATAGEGVPA